MITCSHERKTIVRNQDDDPIAWSCDRCLVRGSVVTEARAPLSFCECGAASCGGRPCDRCRWLDGERSAAAVISALRGLDDGDGVTTMRVAGDAQLCEAQAVRVLKGLQKHGRVVREVMPLDNGAEGNPFSVVVYSLDGGRR